MHRVFVSALLSIVVLSGPGITVAGVALNEEENGRLVVDVRFDETATTGSVGTVSVLNVPGLPPLRYERFYVALPPTGTYRIERVQGIPMDRRGRLPDLVKSSDPPGTVPEATMAPGFFPERPFVVSDPFTFRRTRVIAVDCFATQVDYGKGVERNWPGYVLEVRYTPMAATVASARSDPLVAGLVINRLHLPIPKQPGDVGIRSMTGPPRRGESAIPDPHFSLSSNWVKIRVNTPGVYAITGADLAQIGVDPANVEDPTSFRIFTGGGREQERRDPFGLPYQDANGTWRPGQWMTECDIVVEYGGDGTFDPADRIIFYGVGSRGWKDWYESGAPREQYHDHLYAKENVYYLTWDDSPGFSGAPGRMEPFASAPIPSTPDVETFEERLYFEDNRVETFTYGGDGWLWLEILSKSNPETITFPAFTVRDLDDSRPQTFRTVALAPFKYGELNDNHHAVYIMNGNTITEKVFDTQTSGYETAVPVVTTGTFLIEGQNVFRLHVPRDLHPRDFMYFDFYEVFYHRWLHAYNERLLFSSPDTTGSVNYKVTNFAPATPVYLFDVTDLFRPKLLNGFVETDAGGRREIRFSSSMGANRQYFWAGSSTDFERPAEMKRHFPRDLRNVTTSPNMLVVTHPTFTSSAELFVQHRRTHYPYPGNQTIDIVTTEEIFDNFSGGLVDPMGIRNYCKFLYDNFTDGNGFPILTFLFLLGDANVDFKNFVTPQENLLTTNLNLEPQNLDAYATDDWFVEMELPDARGATYIQVAVGRLPAGSVLEADFLIEKVIDYEINSEYGPWRDRVVLVADDEKSPSNNTQTIFTVQSESIAHGYMAPFLEPHKIYLTEYPAISGIKPASRLDFLKVWNDGALVINYVGHGSSSQMADEQVFLGKDVGNLRNGLRLPLFMAYSCTIGDFGRAQAKSLSEKLLLWEAGGAIAAVTASEVSLIDPNATLNTRFFQEVSPREAGAPEPLGVALLRAKVGALAQAGNKVVMEENSHKYNLLGDPSMQLVSPRRAIRFSASDVDSMTAGKREAVRGEVLSDGVLDTGFSGTVDLVVREPDRSVDYSNPEGSAFVHYRYPGGTVYRGTADVTGGRFEFSVKIPRFSRTGPLAFVRAYAHDGGVDAVALSDTTVFVRPSPGDTTVLTPLDGPPRVEMGFKGGQRIVKPGAVLQARVNDSDGINVLNTTPEGKVALVFDEAALPLDVTESFRFDHGGTDTSGTLTFPLPDLAVGDHRAILKVADSFGQVTLDTLKFTLTDAMNFAAEVVLNYPNPFTTSTYFLFSLTDRAEIQLDIFTVSGKRIRRLRETEDAGEAWVFWDGKDSVGDSIANGTYLYVARVSFVGIDRAPQVLRGKVVKFE